MKTQRNWAGLAMLILATGSLTLLAQTAATRTNATVSATNAASTRAVREAAPQGGNPAAPTTATPDRRTTQRQATPPTSGSRLASSGTVDFSAFRAITDKNIFDGTRTGQTLRNTGRSQGPTVRVDAFALVGTMLSEKGATAFFDGTEPEFRKVYKLGGKIAGYEIKDIKYSGVRLMQGSNTVDIAVGTGLRRENGGLWKLSSASITSLASASTTRPTTSFTADPFSEMADPRMMNNNNFNNFNRNNRNRTGNAGNATFTRSEPVTPPSPPVSAAEVNEVLKRLMEQREKE